ncbi:hypothetical protein ASPCAL06906 [Aspergillus calidoustus]|uniref:Uncharacterized protein n=1 Tax=Aspergillus calidoustus TaxID=454130 RepID=A0A0U5G869_ASPCI|nr:hypothetical protein ASPCAL06906 [Aspergillus calidoustus]
MAGRIDINNDIYRLSAYPFVLEHEGDFEKAIKIHGNAVEILDMTVNKFKKMKVPRANRKMFERQLMVHRQRLAYLQSLHAKGSFEGIVKVPTIRDAMADLARADNDDDQGPGTLSQARKTLYIQRQRTNASDDQAIPTTTTTTQLPPFAPTLPPGAPTAYRITIDSEFHNLNARGIWIFAKDLSNTHTLYALQAIWRQDTPIIEAVLKRPAELLPQLGAVDVQLRRTRGGSFRVETRTLVPDISGAVVVEVPDRGEHVRDWAPRRFEYGGRQFVWKGGGSNDKAADGGLFKAFAWESLYETARVWRREGSMTGKMEDEVVGGRLCWGDKGGANKVDHTIYMAAGLDVNFREHLLAVQLARLVRCSNPPNKDVKGAEAIHAGTGILSILNIASNA